MREGIIKISKRTKKECDQRRFVFPFPLFPAKRYLGIFVLIATRRNGGGGCQSENKVTIERIESETYLDRILKPWQVDWEYVGRDLVA
jgi:hypothetical protein